MFILGMVQFPELWNILYYLSRNVDETVGHQYESIHFLLLF